MSVTRRAVMTGAGALVLLPHMLRASARERDVIAALDAAATEVDPAKALTMLGRFDSRTLPRSTALDLGVARAGLTIDASLRFTKGAPHYALNMQRSLGNDIGLDSARARLEVERIRLHGRAVRLFAQIGEKQGGIGEYYQRLWRDDRFRYSDDATGRTRAVADMNKALAAARLRVGAAFGPIPRWCIDVDIHSLSAADIAAGKGGYRTLPDATHAGAYVVDLKDICRRPSWTLPSVVAHEALPGHMIQLPIEALAKPHPLRLKYAAAFVEGWGIYAEQLAAAQGAFAGDPRAELGHIHWLLFRVGRGIADIGIHVDGWSVDAARAQLTAWQGEPAYFAPFVPDIDRIVREPGVRAAEAMAWLSIADAAQRHRGAALARFHHALLGHGRKRTENFPATGSPR